MINKICTTVVLMAFFAIPALAQEKAPVQTLIKDVHVWDGTSDGVTKRINVLVEDGMIKSMSIHGWMVQPMRYSPGTS